MGYVLLVVTALSSSFLRRALPPPSPASYVLPLIGRLLDVISCGVVSPIKAVALLSEMTSRGIKPDQVCYGAAIAALSEVAASHKHRVHWGRVTGDESAQARDSAVLARMNEGEVEAVEEEENGEGEADRSDRVDGRDEADAGGVADEEKPGDGHVDVRDEVASVGEVEAPATASAAEPPSLPHDKAVSLIEEMRRQGPRCDDTPRFPCGTSRAPRVTTALASKFTECE